MKKTELAEGQYDIFDLTKVQKKKLAALKKAYNECIKANMFPVNYYGSLEFYDRDFIANYGNEDSGFDKDFVVVADHNHTTKHVDIPNEWTDDSHLFLLTDAAKNILQNE